MPRMSIADTWELASSAIVLLKTWNDSMMYIALGGDATIESVKNETIESIKTETIGYQKRSWRQVA
jgi:hypothetical protein